MKRTTPTAQMFMRCFGPVALAALAFTACSNNDSATPELTLQLPPRIAVTSVKGDPESLLLATIYARVLEDGGFRVARKDPVEMDRAQYYQAIQDGTFQLIPDYSDDLLQFVYSLPEASPLPNTSLPTGPATTVAPVVVTTTTFPATTVPETIVVGETTSPATSTPATSTPATTTTQGPAGLRQSAVPPTTDPSVAGDTTTTDVPKPGNGHSIVEEILALQIGMPSSLIVNNGSLAENKQVIACSAATMAANTDTQLTTLTDLASNAPDIVLGGSAAFMGDKLHGLPAFELYYGGEFKDTTTIEDADLAAAITAGDADCFVMNSLDPLITTNRMTILTDDQLMVPTNAALALMASTSATPEAIGTIDAIATALTTSRLNQMLNEIINNGGDPVVVANAFVDTL
ncbi:MAG TPA: glycine betaine ABC transporter substrate-binding protein [Ilumatobacteraceae bacterium]|nr:glycine betaine ABC transporter substrate-binding protein [Ilumatobacteraceae bacterium]HRB02651.1 glycine betaine ABC transporter substrate-binding protein [Ilumatobacteraceae bacterium]